MASLTAEKCVACRAGAPQVTADEEIADLQPQIPDWNLEECQGIPQLERVYSFRNFAQALAFTNAVGAWRKKKEHHPALLTEWGRVDGDVVDAQDQGPAPQRLHHGGQDGCPVWEQLAT